MPNIQPGRHIRITSFPAFRHSRMRSWPKSIRIRAPDLNGRAYDSEIP